MTGQTPDGDDRLEAELLDGVLVLRGEIDATDADSIEQRLRAQGKPDDGYRLDLAGVRFIDSRGIEALFRLAGDGLTITVAAGSLLERIVHTVGLDQVARVTART